jgi:hypothetical protein
MNNFSLEKLFQSEQSFYEVHVRFGDHPIFVHCSFSFLGLLGQNVTLEAFLVSDLSSRGYFESLLGTRICFYFRHFNLFF